MSVVVIDYGSGNLRSAAKALERAAAGTGNRAGNGTAAIEVSADPAALDAAERIVLPGVGAFGACMAGLAALPGMLDALEENVIRRAKPFLGICIGMQLMARRSIEHGSHRGLGWIAGEVTPIAPQDPALKIPHMGWNELDLVAPKHKLLEGIETGDHAYFVHSFAMQCEAPADILARADYGGGLVAICGRDNLVGTQFHPEKSQRTGLMLLANFLAWRP
jgi:glutamine amidotransferase